VAAKAAGLAPKLSDQKLAEGVAVELTRERLTHPQPDLKSGRTTRNASLPFQTLCAATSSASLSPVGFVPAVSEKLTPAAGVNQDKSNKPLI
jgi:hypothetical protein